MKKKGILKYDIYTQELFFPLSHELHFLKFQNSYFDDKS